MKKIFVSTVFGYANKGDWALFNSLKRTLEETYGKCCISATCKNASIQKKYIPDVNWIEQFGSSNRHGIKRYIEIIFGYIQALWLILIFPLSKHRYITALKESDLIVSCPGGYLHDANNSIVTLIINYLVCLRSRKKLVFAPQSIGPIYSKFYTYIVKKILNKAEVIFTRENYSYKFCTETLQLPAEKVINVLDMAFYDNTAIEPEDALSTNRPYIAMTLIHWLYPEKNNPLKEYQKYLEEIASFIKKIINNTSCDIRILKQIEDFGDDIGDEHIFNDIKPLFSESELERIEFLEPFLTPEEMKGIIKHSQCFVGSRMHSNIFALSCTIPVIAISYQPKTAYIMESLGLSNYSLPISEFTGEQIFKLFSTLNNYPEFKTRIQDLALHSKNTFTQKISQL